MIELKPRYFESTVHSEVHGKEKLSGTFTEDEHTQLVDFINYAEDLANVPFLRSKNTGSYKMSHDGNGPIKFDVTLPDWAEVVVFIHLMRPLLLEKEPTSFYKIGSIIGKYTNNSKLVRLLLSSQRDIFSGRRDQRMLQIRSNDELLNSDKVLQSYLNGFEYHRDKEKREFINGLHVMLPLDLSKVIFVGLLIEKASAILSLADLVATITGKEKHAVNFQFFAPNKDSGLPVK